MHRRIQRARKYAFNIIIPITALTPVYPLISLIALPIFFCQARLSYQGHPFTILKSRTMPSGRMSTATCCPTCSD